jgi:signal transduction histidine kinase
MNEKRRTNEFDVDRKDVDERLSMLVHELRTPLAAIRGYAELLENELRPAGQKTKAERIRTLAERLERLIFGWLDVAKSGGEGRGPVMTEIKLRPFLEQILQDLEPQAGAKRHAMTLEGEIPSIALCTDPEALRSILTNLLTNAIRYTPPGGKIALRVRQHDETIRIEVQDNGVGIVPEAQARIFDAFYRTDEAKRMDERGSGLGLYLAKHHVEMLGGAIRVTSQGTGKGSVVSVDLPGCSVAEAD